MRFVPGLRAKLALALVATSAVTLAGAVGTLVPPLEHRIAENRVHDLRELARTADLALARLPASDLRPGARRQRHIVHALAARTGGRVALFDSHGLELADTDPERKEPGSGTPERLVDAGYARDGNVLQRVTSSEAIVVAPVRTHAGGRILVLRKPLGDTHAAVRVVLRAIPVAAAVGLGAAIVLGTILGYGLLRGLENLRRSARRLADEGIEQPVDVESTSGEVGEVANALELMRARLLAQERGRQAFLSTAAHELRTPLASLRGTLELLEEEIADERPEAEGVRRRTAAAARQAQRLSALAEDLLGLGQIDAEVALAAEPIDLAELTGTLVAEAEARAVRSEVTLRLVTAGPTWGEGDPRAAARVIRALIDNALCHGASAGGHVTVSVDAAPAGATVHVADDGPGVSGDDRERIFERFERGSTPRAAGFGLGLSLARGLARRMGGDVFLSPAGPGATFTFLLPPCPAPPTDATGVVAPLSARG